ncbi:MAG: YciI family protein [Jatrophihabitans sp.]
MRFLMLVCRDNQPVPEAPDGGDVEEWVRTMDGKGLRVTGDQLGSDADAVTVRLREGTPQISDGAFLPTDGALLGFDLLECRDLAEATEVALAHPLALRCVLEIRPVVVN